MKRLHFPTYANVKCGLDFGPKFTLNFNFHCVPNLYIFTYQNSRPYGFKLVVV